MLLFVQSDARAGVDNGGYNGSREEPLEYPPMLSAARAVVGLPRISLVGMRGGSVPADRDPLVHSVSVLTRYEARGIGGDGRLMGIFIDPSIW